MVLLVWLLAGIVMLFAVTEPLPGRYQSPVESTFSFQEFFIHPWVVWLGGYRYWSVFLVL